MVATIVASLESFVLFLYCLPDVQRLGGVKSEGIFQIQWLPHSR